MTKSKARPIDLVERPSQPSDRHTRLDCIEGRLMTERIETGLESRSSAGRSRPDQIVEQSGSADVDLTTADRRCLPKNPPKPRVPADHRRLSAIIAARPASYCATEPESAEPAAKPAPVAAAVGEVERPDVRLGHLSVVAAPARFDQLQDVQAARRGLRQSPRSSRPRPGWSRRPCRRARRPGCTRS